MGSTVVRYLFICIIAAVLAVAQEEKVFDLGQLSQYQGNVSTTVVPRSN